jgi:phosphatidylglycerophosphatase A
MKKFSVLISTLFGIGYFPKAPGTAGSLAAAFFYFFIPNRVFFSPVTKLAYLLTLCGVAVLSVYFISEAEEIFLPHAIELVAPK